MKTTVLLEVEPSEISSRYHNIPLAELGCSSQEQWDALPDGVQRSRLQEWADDLPEHPHWCVSSWNIEVEE